MTVQRANPADLRNALSVAQTLANAGIDFVPVPVADNESKAHLVEMATASLAAIEIEAAAGDECTP
ncbi:hypothetical protein [Oceanisphaera sp. KMM 10153]|uniref:DUF1382 family protein n=1 Tax=Oceanisphaera submarina TaxID=3390193 RepID=UPI0039748F0E